MSERVFNWLLAIAVVIIAIVGFALMSIEGDKCEDRGGDYKYNYITKMYKCEMP